MAGSKCIIRRMEEKDWERVSEIYTQGLETNISTFQTECPNYEEWDQNHLKDCRLVAVMDDLVVGFVVLAATSKREVYKGVVEVSLYVDSSYKNCKIGTTLLKTLIVDSEKKGYWSLYSSIIAENVASIRVHERCGFRQVGYREKIARDRFGRWHNTVIMEKRSNYM
ncbi:GNAT family N-acetyltransferase [Anaerosporobacter faecicola]|uniref:GNAT family N-acetyltransferase n=1 Tax=Anaerosporobacter faecicola TaxID=2718714 RepID=UPI001EE510D8|nr:GNAT family N-acetyltransferase [Anaerosporobacter faecicola]